MGKREIFDNIEEASLLYRAETGEIISDNPPAPPAETEEKFKYIGAYTKRLDGKRIVTGKAPYTRDIKLKGMLIGKILRSPHAKAEVVSVDLNAAKNLKGVKAVL